MNLYPSSSVYNQPSAEALDDIQRGFITRVFAWMTLGLVITTGAALTTLLIPGFLQSILSIPFLFVGLLVGEVILVMVIGSRISAMTPWLAGLLFALYAALNGVTLAIIFLIYTSASIFITFGITACMFGIMTLYGLTTKRDLTKIGSLLGMALIGLVLASLVNMFLRSSGLYWIITYIGILIFVGLVAYDTQKLKKMSLQLGEDGTVIQRASVLGALRLYLDFINLFLLLLRILGRRK
jgi:hypothetical protein